MQHWINSVQWDIECINSHNAAIAYVHVCIYVVRMYSRLEWRKIGVNTAMFQQISNLGNSKRD